MKELIRLVPPPEQPFEAGTVSIDSVEEKLGMSFPKSFVEFAKVYGSGRFQLPDNAESLYIFNPFSKRYINDVNNYIRICNDVQKSEGFEYLPYKVHPDKPGLLAFGYGEGRRDLFWFTENKPDVWPIFVWTPERELIRIDESLPEFLLHLFTGEIDCWGAENNAASFKKHPKEILFVPDGISAALPQNENPSPTKKLNRKKNDK